jgi:hypothetical protein
MGNALTVCGFLEKAGFWNRLINFYLRYAHEFVF